MSLLDLQSLEATETTAPQAAGEAAFSEASLLLCDSTASILLCL
ncbi:SapB/AmfS family lanthipeptide [Actinospica durhamensis]|uniref:SapB/AmfS family lanthipeptide n=1 Tax=Actinospica durhamensis TaxID=1508375 RepID=A0A941EYT7_9ACTN|nr:SapB/AmfS family lanthipeptide [Actinospica durhamensis]MBR7839806.1 SapB/AmfS family lanthipeptide [Actinospica durhamensis]